MAYLAIELARTLDEERFREAERCHRINRALAVRQEQSTTPVERLVHRLRGLIQQERPVAIGSEASN
jgi:hypothetical protein